MMKLSYPMRECLRELQRNSVGLWVRKSQYIQTNTVDALVRRGLVEKCYRLDRYNPNEFPSLMLSQTLDNTGSVWRDPWVRLTEAGKELEV